MNTINELWLRWMTDGAVQIAVLIILVGIVAWLGRRLSARWRYALWTLVLVKALLPPFLSMPFSVVNLSMPFFAQQSQAVISTEAEQREKSHPSEEMGSSDLIDQVGFLAQESAEHSPNLLNTAPCLRKSTGR